MNKGTCTDYVNELLEGNNSNLSCARFPSRRKTEISCHLMVQKKNLIKGWNKYAM